MRRTSSGEWNQYHQRVVGYGGVNWVVCWVRQPFVVVFQVEVAVVEELGDLLMKAWRCQGGVMREEEGSSYSASWII